ncbi:MAG: hypothetical protein COY42_16715 [Armatimonadetes bacterium CG_4_10_14_0_8_um_filter_66_14]|nr:MAG: hypothetical protein COS65_33565 [Armatimonadetes bacterium CG06_land_8_20_14_3_00_66_21]PIX39042.1 MAG: hypothetical protein COZ57_29110 [Armatimonadetes bacterium CG_4_8_14_3_um_filter_66_20]PIZ42927.1 MAG: hypothetical protein COY42_16715 [Armatimonadetes bacterium CG_4_10_14_0_8_um_filter_66_14]PJB70124.1 MAG: hypothetical protein CO096_11875 [Armatimonadetes bacterium CG_4_9_14_3_um_filter_66_14]
MGLYLHRADDTVSLAVADVDVDLPDEENLQLARDVAWGVFAEARRRGVSAAVEDSGNKGYHVWVCFAAPVPAAEARQLLQLLVSGVAPLPRKVRVEVFPRSAHLGDDALGPVIKLPFGVHQLTGRRCPMLRTDGSALSVEAFLAEVRPLHPGVLSDVLGQRPQRKGVEQVAKPVADVEQVARPVARERPQVGNLRYEGANAVEALVAACPQLARLAAKPAETGHLTHVERLVLLYTLGRLGEAGAKFIHQTIGRCRNYAAGETQRWLDRLEPDRSPIGCARILDWLGEVEPDWLCDCDPPPPAKPYASPVNFVLTKGAASPRSRTRERHPPVRTPDPETQRVLTAVWEGIAEDLFEA